MARETELYLMPLPVEKLTREEAIDWLREWAGDYTFASAQGFDAEDAEHRVAYSLLARDVVELIDACARVVATGKTERLCHYRDANELPSIRLRLSQILATKPDETGRHCAVYDALARRLVELLAVEAA